MPYYISKVRLATDGPKGSIKWITETYLVNAVSITHAESLVNEDFKDQGNEFEVKSVAEASIVKVIGNTKKL